MIRLTTHITIPNTVKAIDDSAFEDYSNLTNVEFYNKIKEFVSCKAMQDWWNQGVHRSSSMYSFSVKCSIPEHLRLVLVQSRQANIYDMLRRIPTISTDGLNAYFDTINSKLLLYETYKVDNVKRMMSKSTMFIQGGRLTFIQTVHGRMMVKYQRM
jgi:hypothetical protein